MASRLPLQPAHPRDRCRVNTTADHAYGQDAAADDDEPVTACIGWIAFLRAPHIPYAAFEHD